MTAPCFNERTRGMIGIGDVGMKRVLKFLIFLTRLGPIVDNLN